MIPRLCNMTICSAVMRRKTISSFKNNAVLSLEGAECCIPAAGSQLLSDVWFSYYPL